MKLQEIITGLRARWRGMMQSAADLAGVLRRSGTEPVTLSPQQCRTALRAAVAGAVVLVAAIGFGLYQFISLQQARAQEALHEQQLQLMREKTASLQEKMDKMDALDQELRQMVKGAGTGSSPKGDGGALCRLQRLAAGHRPSGNENECPHYQLHYAEDRTERYGGAAGPADAAGISAIRIVDDAVYLAGVRHDYV